MSRTNPAPLDVKSFLSQINGGKTSLRFRKKQIIFSQGDSADAVFYLQAGQVRLAVVSEQGKEAVIALLETGSFLGEGALDGQQSFMCTARAEVGSTLIRIDKEVMIRVLHDEPTFSAVFLEYLLARNTRIQEDLVDQLFNSREKRLARVLLYGPLREGRQAGAGDREDQSGNARQDDRHDTRPCQFLHE